MADQSDVETTLAILATTALYPDGTEGASTTGATTRIYRGWPNSAALDDDLAAGRVNVTIFPVPGATRNTTRYPPDWQAKPRMPTLTVTIAAASATFAGDAALGQLAGILVEGQAYVHRTIMNDSPALVAAILATAIGANHPAIATGATVTVPGANLVARTVADAAATGEVRCQQQTFYVTAWCPTPALRDATCAAIDNAYAGTTFLTFPDGTAGRLRFASTTTFDQSQDAALYRRDLLYTVEFPTIQAALQPSMLFGVSGLGAVLITV